MSVRCASAQAGGGAIWVAVIMVGGMLLLLATFIGADAPIVCGRSTPPHRCHDPPMP
jgi:hypothetical protein